MKNYLKRDNYQYIDFLIFALMELSTNLIKYANGGYVWLIEKDDKYALVCFDNGNGIKDLDSALSSGYTTARNSLGLGLYQIANSNDFNMQIYTQINPKNSGTVVLVSQKGIDNNIVFLTKAYMDLEQNGDYFEEKGKYFIFGDVSGHGIKAQKSAIKIKSFFMDNFFSFSLVIDFFNSLHTYLKRNYLRSSVVSVIEKKLNKIEISGVGNLNIWVEKSIGFKRKNFKDGIVGEVFDSLTTYSFELEKKKKLILTTDGLIPEDIEEFFKILKHDYSSLMLGLCLLHFVSSQLDDNSILIFEGN
jgi:anti-sigma regulatory factor (Ser/Thr protein kinase)